MVYKLVYAPSAELFLVHLHQKEGKKITDKLMAYVRTGVPLKFAKKLKGLKPPHYRFRIGNYRALFRLDPQTRQVVILLVLKIAHRKEAYR